MNGMCYAWKVSNCELMQGRVVELGAGLGLPSLAAAAICRDAVVTATDKDLASHWVQEQKRQLANSVRQVQSIELSMASRDWLEFARPENYAKA
eukprot:38150-Amphidinium_carterae.2